MEKYAILRDCGVSENGTISNRMALEKILKIQREQKGEKRKRTRIKWEKMTDKLTKRMFNHFIVNVFSTNYNNFLSLTHA